MTDDADLITGLGHEDMFEAQMRGYSRRQVDEFVARSRSQTRDLEERLSQALDEVDSLRQEVSKARQDAGNRPAHEEISERVGQILKLADDEAKAQRERAQDEIHHQRDEARQEADRIRTEAREQAERMLKAAQEQAENAIASARTESDKLRTAARAETERAVSEAKKEAEGAVAAATSQAKQMMDEATVRASAIHDGAERRLSLLTSRHTETMRRLTEIRDVVTNLVASETTRGSLEEEVSKSVAATLAAASGAPAAGSRPGPEDGRPTAAARAGARDGRGERGGQDRAAADRAAADGVGPRTTAHEDRLRPGMGAAGASMGPARPGGHAGGRAGEADGAQMLPD